MSNPRISVVMACYNAGQTVVKAIESILAQTEQNFEFIIINDASLDQTSTILHHYSKADSRIQIVTNLTNRGLAYSLNRAIRLAKAPFIARMDADDISLPSRFAQQTAFLQEHPEVDVLGTGTELVDTTGQRIGLVILPIDHKSIVGQRYMRPLFIHPSVIFRRGFFDKCGYYNEQLRRTEDLDLWLRARKTATYSNLPDILMRYTYKPKLPFRTFRSDMAVRFYHMYTSGELVSKGHELLLCTLRFALLNCTGYKGKSLRVAVNEQA